MPLTTLRAQLLAVAALTVANAVTAHPADRPTDQAIKEFQRAFTSKSGSAWIEATEPEVLDAAREVSETMRLTVDGLLAILSDHASDSAERRKAMKTKRAKKSKGPAGPRTFPLPRELMYQFGARSLLALDGAPKELASNIERGKPLDPSQLSGTGRFEQMVHGCLPETELIIASIEASLDEHRGADEYAAFLESWRNGGPNGDESFYEALDRTAGTPDEVFFYDAMLGDFVQRFAKEEGKRWSLGERHDRNQQAFLSYRQYRGLIEAFAFSLVLPPDEALPERLSRYDYGSVAEGAYALRHQVDILVAAHGGDVSAALEFARQLLRDNPPPDKLWEDYAPTLLFGEAFAAAIPEMTTRAKKSSDDLLAEYREERQKAADAIRDAALNALHRD